VEITVNLAPLHGKPFENEHIGDFAKAKNTKVLPRFRADKHFRSYS
jgi:hypothetical protein